MQEIDRTRRVAKLIERELGNIINKDLSDPRVRLVSITGVTVSKDLKHARVYVSQLNSSEDSGSVLDGLSAAHGFLRRQLGRRLNLRYTPDLTFSYDNSIQHGMDISGLIDKARKKDMKKDMQDNDQSN